MKRLFSVFLLSVFLMLALSGCFIQRAVESHQVGLILEDGASVDEVVPEGRYTRLGFYARMETVNVSSLTTEWADPDLVTSDKQPIGLSIAVTYSRDRTCTKDMYANYRAEAMDDEALASLVRTRIPRVAKAITTQFTLDEMLGVSEDGLSEANRAVVEARMNERLTPELEEFCVTLRDVGMNNISPSEAYLALLEEKSNAAVAVEVSRQQTLRLQEQIRQEEAQTAIELERAQRQNEVNAELAKTIEQSPEFYELERLKLWREIVGPNDKFFFVQEGQDFTMFLTQGDGSTRVNPVPVDPGGH